MLKIFLLISLLNISINSQELKDINLNDIRNEKINIPLPKLKEWTIAIYMNGKSNIEPFALNDINRFETIGSDENINIVVEIGRSKGLDNDTIEDGDWEGVRRYFITKDNDPKKINSIFLEDLKNIDMGSAKTAGEFLKWAKINYPSKKTIFLIWDHGWGWINPTETKNNSSHTKSISHDFVAKTYIKTEDLSNIFKIGGNVDLYASMACFMQMAEVAYEIKDYASIIVGSEEVIQLPSFNFEDFLLEMKNNPNADEEEAGKYLTDTFKEMYSRPEYQDLLTSTKYGTQLSAIRSKSLKSFAKTINNIGKLILNYTDISAIKKAKKEVLRFEVGDEITDPNKLISFYADIYDFIDLIIKNSAPSNEKNELEINFKKLKNIIEKEMVVNNVFLNKDRTGKSYSRTHGISMHIPGEKGNLINYNQTYDKLSFNKDSNWYEAIKYLEKLNND